MRPSAKVMADTATTRCELAGDILRSCGVLRFAATGCSMLPSVWSGDTLVVERVHADQIQIGDIALIGRGGRLCAHRVVRLPGDAGNRYWITQGDAMPRADLPVFEQELLGRVIKVIRSGKCVPCSNLNRTNLLLGFIIRRSVFAERLFVYWASRRKSQKVDSLCQA